MPVRRLDPVLIDQIAAGEVVERPAAAVKELVENALDAGATRIAVEIEGGGRTLIRVTDNGHGMGPDDIELAVERHATSKLPEGDLSDIQTLGFRGEALPSIAAVARLSIVSRATDEAEGTEIRVTAGIKQPLRPAPMAKGTRIEVRDLFHATPARLKFLKGDKAEAQAVALVVKRLAMAHPAVRFSFTGVGASAFDYPAGSNTPEGQLLRLGQVLGDTFRDNAVPVSAVRDGLLIEGFAGLPTYHRATASEQFLFVNGRPVRDKVLVGAVRAAYADHLPGDRHPVLALFLSIPPEEIDVNVHPAKTEVRFRDPGLVRGVLVSALKLALQQAGHRASSTGGLRMLDALAPTTLSYGAASSGYRAATGAHHRYAGGFSERSQAGFHGFAAPPQAAMNTLPHSGQSEPDTATAPDPVQYPLGAPKAQLHANYIVAQTTDGLVIVDQHAAHERLVYEKLKRQRSEQAIARQLLLIPEIVEMAPADAVRLSDAAPALEKLGLVIEAFGPGAVAVREVPSALAGGNISALLQDIADNLAEWGGPLALERAADHVLATFACHHSVRAGRQLRPEEMSALLREMEATPGSGQCNHGRPTYVALKLTDIERLFGRR